MGYRILQLPTAQLEPGSASPTGQIWAMPVVVADPAARVADPVSSTTDTVCAGVPSWMSIYAAAGRAGEGRGGASVVFLLLLGSVRGGSTRSSPHRCPCPSIDASCARSTFRALGISDITAAARPHRGVYNPTGRERLAKGESRSESEVGDASFLRFIGGNLNGGKGDRMVG